MSGMREGIGGRIKREGIYAYKYIEPSHFIVQQKLTGYKITIPVLFWFFIKKKIGFFLFFLVLQDCFCKGNPLSLPWFADVRKLLAAYFAQFLLVTVSKNLYLRWHFSSQHFWECLLYIASDYVSTVWITSFS